MFTDPREWIAEHKFHLLATVAGIILAGHHLRGLYSISHFSWYNSLFPHLPAWLVVARYGFSKSLKIAFVITGIGIITRQEFFRKAVIAISSFTIVTMYWKHPLETFRHIMRTYFVNTELPRVFAESPERLVWALFVYNYIDGSHIYRLHPVVVGGVSRLPAILSERVYGRYYL